jgi:Spy/CpxP family protein refolding chaperone
MKPIVILCLSLALAPALPAQQEAPRRVEQLQNRLQLTPEQVQKIRPILEEEAEKLREIRAKYQGSTDRRSRAKMLRELQDVQQSIERRITPILTKEQQAEWKKIREERRAELRERAAAKGKGRR